jgi:hypothetical protein
VDQVVDTLSAALARQGQSTKAVERWYAEMPREEEMLPKDKYTIFDKKEKTYRKGIHSMSMPRKTLQVTWKNRLITFTPLQSSPSGLVSASV